MAVKEKIRIRLQSYDAQLIDAAAEKIVETAKHTGARVSDFTPMAPGVPVPLHYHSDIIELHFMVKGQRKTYVMKGGVRTSYSNTAKEESSASIKVRVDAARDIQNKRFANTGITCNAQIPPEMLHEVCRTAPAADALLKNAFEKFGLSARAYDRVLKVSRTIADLDNSRDIEARHAAEAVRYRTLDRKYWTR